jgi:nicotinate-nucleotide adenylyltransferase
MNSTPAACLRLHSGSAFAGLRIGLLGGSFNPAHAGHRAVSLYALKRLGLNQIWWLVSPQNPLKPAAGMAPLADRLIAARTTARHPRIAVTAIEAALGTVYTVDTLKALCRRFPRTEFVWLMGADNLQQITRWRNWRYIFATLPVAVFRRPAYAAGRGCGKAAEAFDRAWLPASESRTLAGHRPPAWLVLDNPLNPFSATEIRKDRPTWPKQK